MKYGYARCSTDGQTLDSQLLALAQAGITADQIETDEAVSGKTPALDRPGIQSLLTHTRKGDTVVVYSLSRLGRSTMDVLALLQLLESRGVFFRSLTEGFDSATPMGRMVLTIMAAFAQLEREMTVERTKAGLAAAKARGVTLGRSETPGRRDAVAACLSKGMSLAETGRELGLPYNSVKRLSAKIASEPAF